MHAGAKVTEVSRSVSFCAYATESASTQNVGQVTKYLSQQAGTTASRKVDKSSSRPNLSRPLRHFIFSLVGASRTLFYELNIFQRL